MNMPGIDDLMRQAQAFGQRLKQVKEDLGREVVQGSAGGGMVTAEANGHGRILRVRVEPQVVDPDDVEMLQDLVVAAVNQAKDKAKELAASKTRELTGGLPMAGLEDLLGL